MKFSLKLFDKQFLIKFAILCGLFINNCWAQDPSFKVSNAVSIDSRVNDAGSGVDLYKGTLNTSVPIHTFAGKEFDLPISLSYSATGIRTNQIASNVGLGWNLICGGAITRVVNIVPDDRSGNGTLQSILDPSCSVGLADFSYDRYARSDYYRLNAFGLEEVFQNFVPASYRGAINANLKIEVNVGGYERASDAEWIITAEDGTKFYFGQNNAREKNTTLNQGALPGCPDWYSTSTTTWLLTKIISKNKLDEYVFNYQNFQWLDFIPNNGNGKSTNLVNKIINSQYKVNQQMLTSIFHNGNKIIGFNYGNRNDLNFVGGNGNKLLSIVLYKFKSANLYKKINFDYSYFGNDAPGTNFLDKRLKLDQITLAGIDASGTEITDSNYQFEYFAPAEVPRIDSYARDYLGLYNGKLNNVNLIENGLIIIPNEPPGSGEIICNPPNSKRSFYLGKAIVGTLKKIKYPNGGTSVFEYEQNATEGTFGMVANPPTPVTTTTYFTQLGTLDDNSVCDGNLAAEAPNAAMQFLSFTPFINNCAGGPSNPHYLSDSRTVLLRVDNTTGNNLQLTTSGNGIFLIQKLPNSNCLQLNDQINNCYYDTTTIANTSNPCMKNLNQLFYTPTAYSFPADYVLGGQTNCNLDTTLTLPNGNYQVTLWSYDGAGAGVNIFKTITSSINNGSTFVDTNTNLFDGFRIRSISNFDNIKFISKKGYRYLAGRVLERVNNYYEERDYNRFDVYRTSDGYFNAPEIIHYKEVLEIDFDANNIYNGYTKITFDGVNLLDAGTEEEIYPLGIGSDPRNPFASNHFCNIRKNFNNILSKCIFNKDFEVKACENSEYLVNSLENEPNSEAFNGLFLTTNLTKSTNINYFENSSISNSTLFEYDYDKKTKETSSSGEINYAYNANYYSNIQSPVSEITSPTKGNTKFIYSLVPGQLNGIATDRYFITDIEASKSGQPLQPKTRFEYDTDGNMVSTVQVTPGTVANNQWDSLIYGYDNRFVVAKLSGIRYSDIPAALITAIKTASSVAITPTSEAAMEAALNALRTSTDVNLKNAQISTITYNPVYGITMATDSKGYTIYNEYDVFGRPTITKEKDENGAFKILSEQRYNTRAN